MFFLPTATCLTTAELKVNEVQVVITSTLARRVFDSKCLDLSNYLIGDMKDLNALIFPGTNYSVEPFPNAQLSSLDLPDNDFEDDFDIVVKGPTRKSFSVSMRIQEITKPSPRPFL